MNFGQGELGFGACPSAKSYPVAEYCTVLSASTPIAFDAPAITVCASCAETDHTSPAVSARPIALRLTMMSPPFCYFLLLLPSLLDGRHHDLRERAGTGEPADAERRAHR